MKYLLIVLLLAPGGMASHAATMNMNGVLSSTEGVGSLGVGTGTLSLCLLANFAERCPMRQEVLTIAFPALSESARLPMSHPLRHANPKVVAIPLSSFPDGGIYIHEVVRYILGSEDEAAAARQLLEASNYGPAGRHYLLCSHSKAVADGKAFPNTKSAVEYLRKNHVESVLYLTHETSFPKTIPADIMHSGLLIRTLDWHK